MRTAARDLHNGSQLYRGRIVGRLFAIDASWVPKPRVGIVLADAVVRGKIAAALRADNDVFEGEDYTAAFVLLQETDVDILLLGMPLPSGGVSECVELLQRLTAARSTRW